MLLIKVAASHIQLFVDTFPPVISANRLEIMFTVHISINKGHLQAYL